MLHANPSELRKHQLPPVYTHLLSHSHSSAFSSRGSISSLLPHLGFNLYKYSCNFAWFAVIPRWEYNPIWNVQLPAQGADVRLRVSGRRSLSSTLHHRPEERWGMSRHTEGTAEQTECVNSEGRSRFSGRLRAVWAACQKVSRRQK